MRGLACALVLSLAVPSTSWSQETAPLRQWGPAASSLFAAGRSNRQVKLVLADTTARRIQPTYWKEGAIVGGVAVGLLGAVFGAGMCSYSETEQNCAGATVVGAVLGGLMGATVGALIGGQFPKRADPVPAPDSTAVSP